MNREKATGPQVLQMGEWLMRLTPAEYNQRRGWLELVSDPAFDITTLRVDYPFSLGRPKEQRWRLKREGVLVTAPLDMTRFESVPFHRKGDGPGPSYKEIVRRCVEEPAFAGCLNGQHMAEALLLLVSLIPPGEPANRFVFPDTVFVTSVGDEVIPLLVKGPTGWYLDYALAGDSEHFDDLCRLVRFRKDPRGGV